MISTGAPQGCVNTAVLPVQMTAHLKTLRQALKFTDDTTVIGLIQDGDELLIDRRLRSWLSGAVLTTWSLTRSKRWRWSQTSGETPRSPPTHHHKQHCDCSGVIQIPGPHSFSGPEVGQSHWVHGEKGPAEAVLSCQLRKFNLPQELFIQLYSAIIESVLCTSNCLVKLSYRRLRRVVRTAERIIGTTLPTLQELYSFSEQNGWQNQSGPHIQHTHSLNCYPLVNHYRALSTRTTRHRKIFFPQAIHLMNTWH